MPMPVTRADEPAWDDARPTMTLSSLRSQWDEPAIDHGDHDADHDADRESEPGTAL